MAAGSGKQKGAAYERDICRRLSLWVSNFKSKSCFWRSAMSGGRATIGKRKGGQFGSQAGDISAVDPRGMFLVRHFYLECKHYANMQFEAMAYGRKGRANKFWEVTKREAKEHHKMPMMLCRQNRRPDIVVMNQVGFSFLCRGDEKVKILAIYPARGMYVMLLRDMLMLDFKAIKLDVQGKIARKPVIRERCKD